MKNGDIGGIPAVSNSDPFLTSAAANRIQGMPATADIDLKPGMQIHGLQTIEISGNKAGGNTDTAAQSDAKVSQIATDALLTRVNFNCGDRKLT